MNGCNIYLTINKKKAKLSTLNSGQFFALACAPWDCPEVSRGCQFKLNK